MNKSRSFTTRKRKGMTAAAAVAIAVSSLSIVAPGADAQEGGAVSGAISGITKPVSEVSSAAEKAESDKATEEKASSSTTSAVEKEETSTTTSSKAAESTAKSEKTTTAEEKKVEAGVLNVGGGFEGFFLNPTTDVKDVKYSDAEKWGEKLSPESHAEATIAAYIGKMVQQDPKGIDAAIDKAEKLLPMAKDFGVKIPEGAAESLKSLKGKTPEQIAGATTAIFQKAEAELSGKTIDVSSLDKDAKEVYDAIVKFAPLVPKSAIEDVDFVSRTADGDKERKIVALDDIDLKDIPGFTAYDFSKKAHVDAAAGTSTVENKEDKATEGTTSASSTSEEKTETANEAPSILPNAKAVDNVVEQGKDAVIKVKYSNLEKGQVYTIKGVTVDPETGNKTGNEGEFTFTAEEVDGEIEYSIKINSAETAQQAVYTYLYNGDKAEGDPIAKYENLEDADQFIGSVRETNPELKGSVASSTGDIIQSGTEVDVNTEYAGLVPGKKYKVEARLVNADDGADTGALKEEEFTADTSNGSVVVKNLAVANADIPRQTAFLKLYELDGTTPYLIAAYEHIGDPAMTFGATYNELYAEGGVIDQQGNGVYSKKKKKVAPKTAPEQAPAPVQKAPAQAPLGSGGGAPAPAGGSGGSGGGAPVANAHPRQVVNAIPSGDTEVRGNDIFSK